MDSKRTSESTGTPMTVFRHWLLPTDDAFLPVPTAPTFECYRVHTKVIEQSLEEPDDDSLPVPTATTFKCYRVHTKVIEQSIQAPIMLPCLYQKSHSD
jgi:hypothetical protein